MTDAFYPDSSERLPWLPNAGSQPNQKRSIREHAGWSVAALLLLASASYWLGSRSGEHVAGNSIGAAPASVGAAKLPAPAPIQPQVQAAPVREPAPARVVQASAPPREVVKVIHEYVRVPQSAPVSAEKEQVGQLQQPSPALTAPPPAPRPELTQPVVAPTPAPLTLWPSRQVKGASGRLVQIGSFGSTQQAKLGWRHMQQAYPAVGRLPAVVVETRNSRGRRFYRFQIGTTSQAHSEILCQRMKIINFSCAVIGLPWKEKVER